jgi:hypothetical protein
MNDVRSLLSQAVPEDLRADSRWPDAEPDIARGRRMLAQRRRRVALTGGTGLVVVGVVGGLLLNGPFAVHSRTAPGATVTARSPGGVAPRSLTPGAASSVAAPGTSNLAVALVAYEGKQPNGYTLKTIPEGWEVASADTMTLVLHKIGTPTGGSFLDKIVIMGDLNPFPTSGDKAVTVNGAKGWYYGRNATGHWVGLVFQTGRTVPMNTATDANGKADMVHPKYTPTPLNVVIQMPDSLVWNVATMVQFASGVTVEHAAAGTAG